MAIRKVPQRRSPEKIADDVKTIRRLIQLADQLLAKGLTDLGVARSGLADIEHELRTGELR
jgi:hypothetical protein